MLVRHPTADSGPHDRVGVQSASWIDRAFTSETNVS
jgi:hypothetical protein